MRQKSLFYSILILSLLIAFPVFAKKKHSKKDKELLKKALTVLQIVTREGSIEAKAEAAGIWGMIRSEKSEQVLLQLIKDKNHNVMSQAALALYTLGNNTGKEVLEDVLEEEFLIDPDASTIEKFKLFSRYKFKKIFAAEALGKIGDGVSFRKIKILRSETNDGQIRDGCSIALAMLDDPGERVIFENAVSLSHKDARLRETAVKALGTIASPASVGVLKKSLHDPVPKVRLEAAVALGKIGKLGTARALRDRMTDEDIRVKREIIRSLGVILDQDNVPVITHALDNEDAVLRLIAAGALGPYGYEKGLSDIKMALRNKDRDARLQAVESLSQMQRNKKVFPFLEHALEDEDDFVRIKACSAIVRKILKIKRK